MKPETKRNTPAPRYAFAVRWPCGVCSRAETGRPYRTVHRFAAVEARNQWVGNGSDFRSSPGFREIATAAEVKNEIRAAHASHPTGEAWRETDDPDVGHEVLDG